MLGVSIERAGEAGETHTEGEVVASEVDGTHIEGEGVESTEGEVEASHTDEESEAVDSHTEDSDEAIRGLNLENPWLVAAFAGVSLVLAVAVLRLGQPALLVAILFAGGAALLDLREVAIQVQRANWLVAGLAVLVALTHGTAAIVAARAWHAMRGTGPAQPAHA